MQLGAYSTTLYNVLNDTFQALIAFIVPIFFKEIATPLTHIINQSFTTGIVPNQLKGNRHKQDLKIRFWCVYIP